MTNHDPLQAAIEAARAAGGIAMAAYRRELVTRSKGVNDFVTEVDEAAEEAIVSRLLAAFPNDGILAEERGAARGTSGFNWLIDPLDGTHNYAAQLPFWCVSIGRVNAASGQPDIGVIYDALHDELFTAQAGFGSWLNGQPISVSTISDPYASLVASDLGYVDVENERTMATTLRIRPAVRRIRMLGSAALALAYVACGRLDAFYHTHLQPWDLAAGWLLMCEAGGNCTDWGGVGIVLENRELLATNGQLHTKFVRLLATETAGE